MQAWNLSLVEVRFCREQFAYLINIVETGVHNRLQKRINGRSIIRNQCDCGLVMTERGSRLLCMSTVDSHSMYIKKIASSPNTLMSATRQGHAHGRVFGEPKPIFLSW